MRVLLLTTINIGFKRNPTNKLTFIAVLHTLRLLRHFQNLLDVPLLTMSSSLGPALQFGIICEAAMEAKPP